MPQVHKSVQCTFAVLQEQPRVLEVVLREQVVLYLQRSASIDTLSTTAQSVSIILKKEAHQTYVRALKGAIERRTQW